MINKHMLEKLIESEMEKETNGENLSVYFGFTGILDRQCSMNLP